MKKIWMICLMVTSIGYITKAQDEVDAREKLVFGIKIGLNYSNVYDSKTEDFDADSKVGFAGGAFLAIPLNKYVGFQPEVLFSQRGFRAKGVAAGYPYEVVRTSNYLDIPLLLALKPFGGVTFVIGPQFSYLLSQRDEFKSTLYSVDQEQQFKNDNIRKNTLCFTSGLDFNFNRVQFSTRVGWDILNNMGDGSNTSPRYKNIWLQGALGLRLY